MDLIDDRVDLALRITDRPSPGVDRPPVDENRPSAVRHAALRRSTARRSTRTLWRRTAASIWAKRRATRKFRRSGKTVTVNVRGRYAANHTGVRLDAVKQHIGIGSLPYLPPAGRSTTARSCRCCRVGFPQQLSRRLWLLYAPNQYLPPKLRVFIDYLVACWRRSRAKAPCVT